jgi:hypothetical protein
MMNLHLLETNKQSRLYLYKSNGCLFLEPSYMDYKGDTAPNQHIYITSDEEIKDCDSYVINVVGEKSRMNVFKPIKVTEDIVRKEPLITYPNGGWCEKVILTTDQDLIKDGVEPIGDKFLEWFIKNPTCNKVKVKNSILKVADRYGDGYRAIPYLEVMIPKVSKINKNNKLYSEIEYLIINWNNDGTKTAGSLTRDIMELIK